MKLYGPNIMHSYGKYKVEHWSLNTCRTPLEFCFAPMASELVVTNVI